MVNETRRSFDRTGLVAISTCGHWWTYPWDDAPTMLHEVVAFHGLSQCSFCAADQSERSSDRAGPVAGRRN